jgi:membrane protease YdiL (CAAX protease family)
VSGAKLTVGKVSPGWSVRYSLVVYGVSWLFVATALIVAWLLFGVRGFGAAGAIWFDVAWLGALVPLSRVGVLSVDALGLRSTPAIRAVGLGLVVLVTNDLFDAIWRSALAIGPVSSPFSGISSKATGIIVFTGLVATVTPVIEEVFFCGFLFRCFRNRVGLLPASMMVGLLFGLVHTEYQADVLPELMVYGGLLCVLYERSGSLWPGIALNMYLDAGGFEEALTGSSTIVFWSFVLLVTTLLARRIRWRTA